MAARAGAACDFARDYEIAQEPLMREIERCVRGSDYGATSWTTREQAEQAAARLGLARGQRLLELGAGSGWPALFLATLSGCEYWPLTLPFADQSFDRLHHADVLCCMERKREMLCECRRVTRAGARMEFSVISLVREPSGGDEKRLLQQSGPPCPDAGADYAVLLEQTGWTLLERIDVAAEFMRCIDVLLEESHARHGALVELLGDEDYAERLERRRSTRAAVACGLLRREIFLAQPARTAEFDQGTLS